MTTFTAKFTFSGNLVHKGGSFLACVRSARKQHKKGNVGLITIRKQGVGMVVVTPKGLARW
jgi:hypothetical protein